MGANPGPAQAVITLCLISRLALPVFAQSAVSSPAAAARETLVELELHHVAAALPELRESLHRDNFSWTPLMIAAAVTSDPAVITALIEAGEDLEARSLDDMTPLMFAAAFNPDPGVSIALIEAGADPEARTRDSWVAGYGVARFTGRPVQVDDLFAGAGAGTGAGASIADTSTDAPGEAIGWTALFLATRHNPGDKVAAALIQAGANPDARDENGATAVPAGW